MVPVTPAGPGQNCSALAFPTLDPRHARGSRPIQRARSFRRRPESRGGMGGANDTRTPPPTSAPNLHTVVCRRQPAWAIGTKMMWRGLPSSFRRRPESRGEGRHQPHPKTSNDQVSFSYFGVAAPAGMSDCYESMSRTPIRDRPLQQPLIGHSRHPFVIPAPRFVIPANAGIQRGGERGL